MEIFGQPGGYKGGESDFFMNMKERCSVEFLSLKCLWNIQANSAKDKGQNDEVWNSAKKMILVSKIGLVFSNYSLGLRAVWKAYPSEEFTQYF